VLYENALFGHGLASIFPGEGLEVVGVAEKGEEAFHQLRALKPNVVTVEGEGARRVLAENPGVRVVRVGLEEERVSITTGNGGVVILVAPQNPLRAIAGALKEEAEDHRSRMCPGKAWPVLDR
jgi:DNA-binding NarL/FixJ family response regulator